MFGDIRRYMELGEMDCSFLVKPIENYVTVVPRTDEMEKERYYYKEPNICLVEYK